MWFSVVYSFIDNDTRHHSGQNLLRTHSAAPRESTTSWPLWWRVSLSIKLCKITKIVRTLWLAERRACMRVCNHDCDVTLSVSPAHFKAVSLLNSQVQILRNSNEENFSKFWFGDWPSLRLWARGKKAKERRTTALVSDLDDLVKGAQAKTTKYATKYAVNVFAFNYYNKIFKITFCFF